MYDYAIRQPTFFFNKGGVSKDSERGFINDHVGYTIIGMPLGKKEIT
jgi:hypothetical protein